jgi:hypothetical protein
VQRLYLAVGFKARTALCSRFLGGIRTEQANGDLVAKYS